MNEWIMALLLGLLQGVAEFLPVSSSGHLALAGMLFGVQDAGLTLNVLLHAGTLVATVVVLRQRLGRALADGLRALAKPSLFKTTSGGQDAAFVILATIPTAVIGFGLRDLVASWTVQPLAVGLGFSFTTALLISTRYMPGGRVEFPGAKEAVIVGLAQGLAVVPGISRSGTTIALLLFLGTQRGRSFELSMLMSIPAVLGAVILEAPHAFEHLTALGPALFGATIAALSGVGALLALRKIVVGGRFPLFAVWTAPLALATLAMARAWP